MTREEIADKFEELAKGFREGKILQELSIYDTWKDFEMLRIDWIFDHWRFRPEPQYIPFTADDWKEFFKKKIMHIDTKEEREVVLFCPSSVRLTDGDWLI